MGKLIGVSAHQSMLTLRLILSIQLATGSVDIESEVLLQGDVESFFGEGFHKFIYPADAWAFEFGISGSRVVSD